MLSRGEQVLTIPGARDVAHIRENLAATDRHVDVSVLMKSDALINQSTVSGRHYPQVIHATIDTEDLIFD